MAISIFIFFLRFAFDNALAAAITGNGRGDEARMVVSQHQCQGELGRQQQQQQQPRQHNQHALQQALYVEYIFESGHKKKPTISIGDISDNGAGNIVYVYF
ncbi:unnamed protein product [Ceratitis capitata]|uniref:(Mediterranean fruit fly) hypothetical protein n=1 Tax=Ceratitis capitata TaxID=7213 RepID=A0A811TXV9_CERCA|nr:unnamed protein product [Ceratitis capitata]